MNCRNEVYEAIRRLVEGRAVQQREGIDAAFDSLGELLVMRWLARRQCRMNRSSE